jgi:hypothetical protein
MYFPLYGNIKMRSGSISRILYSRKTRSSGHSSSPGVAPGLKRPTRESPRLFPALIGPGAPSSPIWPCTGWGLPGRSVATAPVRSYRTISPLPVGLYQKSNRRTKPECCHFKELRLHSGGWIMGSYSIKILFFLMRKVIWGNLGLSFLNVFPQKYVDFYRV